MSNDGNFAAHHLPQTVYVASSHATMLLRDNQALSTHWIMLYWHYIWCTTSYELWISQPNKCLCKLYTTCRKWFAILIPYVMYPPMCLSLIFAWWFLWGSMFISSACPYQLLIFMLLVLMEQQQCFLSLFFSLAPVVGSCVTATKPSIVYIFGVIIYIFNFGSSVSLSSRCLGFFIFSLLWFVRVANSNKTTILHIELARLNTLINFNNSKTFSRPLLTHKNQCE